MPGYKANGTPDGASLHYQLIKADGDDVDVQLKDAGTGRSVYHLHLTREDETTVEHLTLHDGDSTSSPVAAAVNFLSPASGEILSKTSADSSPPLTYDAPRNAIYTQFTILEPARKLRWYKTYQTPRRIPYIKRPQGYILWMLQDITSVPAERTTSLSDPVGTTLATLRLQVPDQTQIVQGVFIPKDGAEIGNLVWITLIDRTTQDLAIALVLALWHRDRQMFMAQPLAPKAKHVSLMNRTQGRVARGPWEAGASMGIGGAVG